MGCRRKRGKRECKNTIDIKWAASPEKDSSCIMVGAKKMQMYFLSRTIQHFLFVHIKV